MYKKIDIYVHSHFVIHGVIMAKANYDLPQKTLERVQTLSGAKSKKEAIIIAMNEYIKKKKIEDLIASRGKINITWTQKSLQKYRA